MPADGTIRFVMNELSGFISAERDGYFEKAPKKRSGFFVSRLCRLGPPTHLHVRRIATMPSDARPRILICRMSAIGDAILTMPVACALRDEFPNAHIAWVVEKKAAPMIRHHQALDQVIEFERGWMGSVGGLRAAREELRSHQFDVTIDCQGLTKSSLAAWLSGAPKRIGFSGYHGGEVSRFLNNTLVTPVFTHLTDRSLELLIPLDIHSPKVRWKLPLNEAARKWANRWRMTVPTRLLAVLNPGAAWRSKLWEPDRFAATARYIQDRYGYRSVVVWGTADERQMAEKIVELSAGAATLAPTRTSITWRH